MLPWIATADWLPEKIQCAPVTNTDHGRPPLCSAQQAVELRFGYLVKGRRCLVEEKDRWLYQQNAGQGESLLFTKRQALRPALDDIKFIRERAKPYLLEGCGELRRGETVFIPVRVDKRAGERTERQIRPLRHGEHSPFTERDRTATERPKPCDRS